MPIYEYECQNCKHKFDILQKMIDTPLKTCTSCDKDSLIKVMSPSSHTFVGGPPTHKFHPK